MADPKDILSVIAALNTPGAKGITPQNIQTMKDQYAKSSVDMFDYGQLEATNPLAYLGFQHTPRNQIGTYTTPINANGITVPQADNYGPMVSQLMKEANVPNKRGSVMLGPDFVTGSGREKYTMTHELMHRGMQVLEDSGYKRPNNVNQEDVAHSMGALQGSKDDITWLRDNGYSTNKQDMTTLIQKIMDQVGDYNAKDTSK